MALQNRAQNSGPKNPSVCRLFSRESFLIPLKTQNSNPLNLRGYKFGIQIFFYESKSSKFEKDILINLY